MLPVVRQHEDAVAFPLGLHRHLPEAAVRPLGGGDPPGTQGPVGMPRVVHVQELHPEEFNSLPKGLDGQGGDLLVGVGLGYPGGGPRRGR